LITKAISEWAWLVNYKSVAAFVCAQIQAALLAKDQTVTI